MNLMLPRYDSIHDPFEVPNSPQALVLVSDILPTMIGFIEP
jgi:hypothetical protein